MAEDTSCNDKKKKKDNTFPIEYIDTFSGQKFTYTPASTASMAFTKISDKYVEENYAPISGATLTDGVYVTKADLELYILLGYLEKLSDDMYILTDKGREALKWNQEFKKQWQGQDK